MSHSTSPGYPPITDPRADRPDGAYWGRRPRNRGLLPREAGPRCGAFSKPPHPLCHALFPYHREHHVPARAAGQDLGVLLLDIHRADPKNLYAIVENLNLKPGLKEKKAAEFDAFADGLHEGVIGGEVYRSNDGGESWKKVSPDGLDLSGKAAYSFNEIFVDPKDPEKVFLIGVSMM